MAAWRFLQEVAAADATPLEAGAEQGRLSRLFRSRMQALTDRIVATASPGELEAVLEATTPFGAALHGLNLLVEHGDVGAFEPLAAARLRGLHAKAKLIEDAGGLLDAGEVAQLLGIGRDAVGKRRQADRLLAVPRGDRAFGYPRCQFGEHGLLPGFEQLLAASRGVPPWTRLALLTSAQDELGGRTPIEALRAGDRSDAAAAAGALTAAHL
ncbi:MAG: hypothetical protein U1E43_02585 [Rhodospirillales bacterium]